MDGENTILRPQPLSMRILPAWRVQLARRLPFYYGWVVFAITASTSYAARPLMSVAVLSVFVVPMTDAFGWSRGLFAGAVSLGGLCAVVISPMVGRLIDRYGSGWMISVTSAVAGACAIGLSVIRHPWTFYALYAPGRMVFASPLELATTTALGNWFIRRRAFVLALLGVTQGTGLAAMPLVAQRLIAQLGWRRAWTCLGFYTLAVGIVPAVLLITRRPEDMGLLPDPAYPGQGAPGPGTRALMADVRRQSALHIGQEQHFTLSQALQTRAFWVLAAFSAVGFMAQGGISLHQVAHYLHQGLSGAAAASTASIFAAAQVPGGLLWSAVTKRLPVRAVLALAGLSVALGAAGTAFSATWARGILSAGLLGAGVGGLHLLLRLAWAEYYGRQYLGTIRGVTLPVQLGGQAIGPITAGLMFDTTGSYRLVFIVFASIVAMGSLLVLAAVPPSRHGVKE